MIKNHCHCDISINCENVYIIKFFLLTFITLRTNYFVVEINKFVSNKVLSIFLSKNLLWHANYNKSTFLNIIITDISILWTLHKTII